MVFSSCWSFLWHRVPKTEDRQRTKKRICDLPDDLLLRILLLVPTKDAVRTSILSKRWSYVWTMLPELDFKDEGSESHAKFIEKSLQLHKAPKLKSLTIKLGPGCAADIYVGNWVENAVKRGLEKLNVNLQWNSELTSFPMSLYTCDTLVDLTLSHNILVDVSFPASLPSLLGLDLSYVVYKDQESLVRLLSSSPVLKHLVVKRHEDDNLTNFIVKVPSLQTLCYYYLWKDEIEIVDDHYIIGLLVIDTPALTYLDLINLWEDYCLIESLPCLDVAYISLGYYPNDMSLRSLSSVMHLDLTFTEPMVACCDAIEFSRLIEFNFEPECSVDWSEPLMCLLQNSPKLKNLTIYLVPESLPPSWNQPSSIPGCLSSHLEIFRWRGYGGRENEKQLLAYILVNSKNLKTVEISPIATCNLEEIQKEIESMPRISTTSRLLFPTKWEWIFNGQRGS